MATEVAVEESVLSGQLANDLAKARDGLREIDDSIKSLTGRTPIELLRFGRGFGGTGGGGGRFVPGGERSGSWQGNQQAPTGPAGRLFQVASRFIQDNRLEGVKRRFTAADGTEESEEIEPDGADRKRFRRGAAGIVRINRRESGRDGDSNDTGGTAAPPRRPALASSVIAAPKEVKSRETALEEIREQENKAVKQRNRRMFQNVLLGTLQKFSQDELRFKRQKERQEEVERRLEEAKHAEQEKLDRDKRELMQKRREQQNEIRRLQRKMAMIEAANEWETHMQRMKNFIQTQAKPPLFYLPAKHTMRTVELQRKSVKRIDELINHHKERLQRDLSSVDVQEEERAQRRQERSTALASGGNAVIKGGRLDRGRDRPGSESEEESSDEEEGAINPAIIGDEKPEESSVTIDGAATIQLQTAENVVDWDVPQVSVTGEGGGEGGEKKQMSNGVERSTEESVNEGGIVKEKDELRELHEQQMELNFEEV